MNGCPVGKWFLNILATAFSAGDNGTMTKRTAFSKFITHVEQNVLAPRNPRGIRAMYLALCRVYATVYAVPGPDFATARVKSECLSRLGDENIARIELIADCWRMGLNMPTFAKGEMIFAGPPKIPDTEP